MTLLMFLVIAICLTIVSLRWVNLLFSLGAAVAWLVLMAYNFTNPPTGVTIGSTIHEWSSFIFIIMAIAMILIWARGRKSTESITRVSEGRDGITARTTSYESRGLMNLSETEYKSYIRGKTHLRRRGR